MKLAPSSSLPLEPRLVDVDVEGEVDEGDEVEASGVVEVSGGDVVNVPGLVAESSSALVELAPSGDESASPVGTAGPQPKRTGEANSHAAGLRARPISQGSRAMSQK